jgi:hypothetical protein
MRQCCVHSTGCAVLCSLHLIFLGSISTLPWRV